ncbi:hypothetical protein Tco_0157907, partial [Tanacetum coccineum]
VLSLGALLLVEKAHAQNLAYQIMMWGNTALHMAARKVCVQSCGGLGARYEILGCGDRNATYSFHVTKPGWHWVRLHFYPVKTNEFKLNERKFMVVANEKVVLLHVYSPKGLEIWEYWVLWL